MNAIWNALKKLNRNQVMLLIGLVVAEGPDVAAVATWLGGLGIPHLAKLVHLLGWLSTALASAALAWPRIRAKLAAVGLATPPGGQAPWSATTNPGVVPIAQMRAPDPDSVNVPAKRDNSNDITKDIPAPPKGVVINPPKP